ncbi:glycosyltransferase [Planomicrobium sp. CPCC 101079]|uniref:glycosyltransferase n=1 Tax=Planomicrobium sp. CPCC 101079 TaxID=2599618 RepID=UPI0016442A43|nr:glycosyltransferase [Planomicrobium sp. CPCC 101079]
MEYVAADLAEQLSKLGHNVILITTSLKPKQKEQILLKKNGYSIISIPYTKSMVYSKSWWKLVVPTFERLNEEVGFDIVFSISAAANSLVKNKKSYNIPFVFQAHGTSLGEIKTKLKLSFMKRISIIKNIKGFISDSLVIPNYDLVITIGEKVYNDYLSSKLKLNKNILLINNAINTKKFQYNDKDRNDIRKELNIPLGSDVYISTSRLHLEKGVKESIDIFKRICEKYNDSYFLIIGDGPEKQKLKAYINELKLEEKVLLIGEVKRDQLNKYYSSANYMLFATLRQEGLPLSLLEALSSSIICFVSELIYFDERLPFKKIRPRDSIYSSKEVIKYLQENNQKRDLEKAKDIISTEFSMERWADRYLEAFKSLKF